MSESGSIAQDKRVSGALRSGVASGLVAGLVATSLGAAGAADATCVGFSGIDIGDGCTTQLGTIAAVLGPGTATALGFFTGAIAIGDSDATADGLATAAWAGGTGSGASTDGIANWAVAQGDGVSALAGLRPGDWANFAVNFGQATGGATSTVEAGNGAVNLAGNLFGDADIKPLTVRAGGNATQLGFGAVAANVFGDRSDVEAIGTLLNATNWGSAFRETASDSTVAAGTSSAPGSLSWAFNFQGLLAENCSTSSCPNSVSASGPWSVAGVLGLNNTTVSQPGPGITLASRLTSGDFEFEDLIIRSYHAIEYWVRYGFELATYAVGWIPWVGWLAPQIMIFYNLGENIVETLVENSANWLWGPLPFGEGLANIAEDSWNALLQFGREQWNFWLPPLPPLPGPPGTAQQTGTTPAQLLQSLREGLGLKSLRDSLGLPSLREGLGLKSLRESLGLQSLRERLELPDLPAENTPGATAATTDGLIDRLEGISSNVGTPSIPAAVTEAVNDGTVSRTVAPGITSASDANPTNNASPNAVRLAPGKAADAFAAGRAKLRAKVTRLKDAATATPRGIATHAADADGTAAGQSPESSATGSAKRTAVRGQSGGGLARALRSAHDAVQKKSQRHD